MSSQENSNLSKQQQDSSEFANNGLTVTDDNLQNCGESQQQRQEYNNNDKVTFSLGAANCYSMPTSLSQKSFNDLHKLDRPPQKSFKTKVTELCKSQCSCSAQLAYKTLKKRIPILDWLPNYNIKNNLVSDVLGGITIGIMQIPQGMAYALLANLPPVVGLYVSFFPVLVYFFFGTSKHVSVGTFAVVSIMTAKIINTYLSVHHIVLANETISSQLNESMQMPGSNNVQIMTEESFNALKIQIAIAAAFFVGVIQLIMAVFQLGALSVYLSDMLISGFTTGAAVHVLNSQLPGILGIRYCDKSGLFGVIHTYINIISALHETNLITLGLSIVVTIALVLVNDYINARYRDRMIMPVPMELILIIITTLASYCLQINKNYDIKIVKHIQKGLPPPVLPPFDIIPNMAGSCFSLAIISYCIPISLAKISANKHKYDIDANQELVAYGAANIIGSFFSCFPSCASLSRSTVQEMSGAKTQIASFVSCILVLIVLVLIAPLFQPVPICVFSVIIIVSLRGMFRQVHDFTKAWKISKTEAAIWMVSFSATVVLDVDLGLLISICFLLITILFKVQRPYVTVLGHVPETDKYLDINIYKVPKELPGIKIVHFGGALYFANRDFFKDQLYAITFNPQKKEFKYSKNTKLETAVSSQDLIKTFKLEFENIQCHYDKNSSILSGIATSNIGGRRSFDAGDGSITSDTCSEPITAIIIDCSIINFIDSSAVKTLAQLCSEYEDVGVNIYLSGFTGVYFIYICIINRRKSLQRQRN